jgi:uncharacterized protein YndB with AHSA1/START domain
VNDKRCAPLAHPMVLLVVGAIGLAACSTPAPAPAPPAPAPATAAPAQTSALTCGGQGTDPAAKIRYSSETTITAPLSTIWQLQTDVEDWTRWQSAVSTVDRLDDGPLRAGSRFRWTTPVPETTHNPATTLDITSTVHRVEDESCLQWSGPAVGKGLSIDEGTHVWTFAAVDGGVRVRTEETWTGAQVEADVAFSTAALGAGLETWLKELKVAAEGGTAGG